MKTHHHREENPHLSLLHPADAAAQHAPMPQVDELQEEDASLVLLLEGLANPIRFRLLGVLAQEGGTLCVRELVERLPRSQPAISHHLRILLFSGLIGVKRQGTYAYYFIRPEKLGQVREALTSVEHLCQQRREDQRS